MAAAPPAVAHAPPRDYFSLLSGKYARQTGDSTRDVFAAAWDDISAVQPITASSVVHDNAAGPGTASTVIVEKLGQAPEILITDNVPPMIAAAKDEFAKSPSVTAQVLDSHSLEGVPDAKFTHSILNISVFLFQDPVKALKEIHRTLRPDGVAALLTWKDFGVAGIIHDAQRAVRPDLPALKFPGSQFLDRGVLTVAVVAAGFDASRTKTSIKKITVTGDKVKGLEEFTLSDFTKPARIGWSEEDVAKWPEAVKEAIKSRVDKNGGIVFEAWSVITQK